jgi:hypothetical protein
MANPRDKAAVEAYKKKQAQEKAIKKRRVDKDAVKAYKKRQKEAKAVKDRKMDEKASKFVRDRKWRTVDPNYGSKFWDDQRVMPIPLSQKTTFYRAPLTKRYGSTGMPDNTAIHATGYDPPSINVTPLTRRIPSPWPDDVPSYSTSEWRNDMLDYLRWMKEYKEVYQVPRRLRRKMT